jgi:FHS family L-fucose permease-like MFS transporter
MLWGVVTSLNSMLVPFLREIFILSHMESMLVQVAFYFAPFTICLPIAFFLSRWGYVAITQVSLVFISIGCFLFYPAAEISSYIFFLIAIFVLAMGVAALQVAATPFVVLIGNSKSAASRLSFCSSLNSIGVTLASIVGMGVFMTALVVDRSSALQSVKFPYMLMGLSALILSVLFVFLKKINTRTDRILRTHMVVELFQNKAFLVGAIAIFLYVGAEVSIGTFLIGYLTDGDVLSMSPKEAGIHISLYWGGAMVGRAIGVAVLVHISPRTVLICNSIVAVILCILAMIFPGYIGACSLTLIGLCNSVLYPIIFSHSVKNSGGLEGAASAILIMCGVGGGLMPLLQAFVADQLSLLFSFIVPSLCYGLITLLFIRKC